MTANIDGLDAMLIKLGMYDERTATKFLCKRTQISRLQKSF